MKDHLKDIVKLCRKKDRQAQKELYEMYAPLFYAIALRYMKDHQEAEDVLVQAFFKIFQKLNTFKNEGSFEGWMKRIVINEALMALRKINHLHVAFDIDEYDVPEYSTAIDDLQYEELIELIEQLPEGYRTVFNLYEIDGYKHREIADILDISINTSKSQLIQAKKRLRQFIKKKVKQVS